MTYFKTNDTWTNGAGKPIPTVCIQSSRSDNTVPRDIAEEAYKEYAARYGTEQSLDRLCERGGFGASELAILLYHRVKRLEQPASVAVPPVGGKGAT